MVTLDAEITKRGLYPHACLLLLEALHGCILETRVDKRACHHMLSRDR
jgi:hypothetical protein